MDCLAVGKVAKMWVKSDVKKQAEMNVTSSAGGDYPGDCELNDLDILSPRATTEHIYPATGHDIKLELAVDDHVDGVNNDPNNGGRAKLGVGDGAWVVYRLDDANPQTFRNSDGILLMSDLKRGVHVVHVQLLGEGGRPLTAVSRRVFQIGDKLDIRGAGDRQSR